ncbi:MAG: MAPEG family protein [Rhodobacteraceae bacterium]|nr:MAPEG family protein [Paracoccaceae bacterium]
MTTELSVLAYAGLLQFAQLSLAIVFGDTQTGLRYGLSARDEPRPFFGLAARVDRALTNHYAALGLFTIAVLVVTLGDKSTPLTVNCAWAYLIARTLYVPAYMSGIFFVRSVLWGISFLATIIMLVVAIT